MRDRQGRSSCARWGPLRFRNGIRACRQRRNAATSETILSLRRRAHGAPWRARKLAPLLRTTSSIQTDPCSSPSPVVRERHFRCSLCARATQREHRCPPEKILGHLSAAAKVCIGCQPEGQNECFPRSQMSLILLVITIRRQNHTRMNAFRSQFGLLAAPPSAPFCPLFVNSGAAGRKPAPDLL